MTQVWSTPMESHTTKLVLLALADNASDEGVCWPSLRTLSRKCDLGKRNVQKHIEILKSKGLLRVESGDGKKNSRYLLLPEMSTSQGGCTDHPGVDAPTTQGGRTDHPITIIEPSQKPSPPIVPQGGRKSSKASSVSDRTREVASHFWLEWPSMKPVGEKRVSKDLSNLEAILASVSEQELVGMIRSLKGDSYRHSWVANFSQIADNLTRIRAWQEQSSVLNGKTRRPTFTERWLAEQREGGGEA